MKASEFIHTDTILKTVNPFFERHIYEPESVFYLKTNVAQ